MPLLPLGGDPKRKIKPRLVGVNAPISPLGQQIPTDILFANKPRRFYLLRGVVETQRPLVKKRKPGMKHFIRVYGMCEVFEW